MSYYPMFYIIFGMACPLLGQLRTCCEHKITKRRSRWVRYPGIVLLMSLLLFDMYPVWISQIHMTGPASCNVDEHRRPMNV